MTAFGSPAYGKVIYVDDDAWGLDNGTSWSNAYVYLQDALAEAVGAAKPVEIWVAQGVYRPDQGASQKLGDPTATYQLLNQVSLRGGFAGVGQPDPDARDVSAYQTVLSGDLQGDDGPGFANYEDNVQVVVTVASSDQTAVLEGFTITGGYGWSGAGLNCYDSNAVIDSCTFTANKAASLDGGYGGAISISGGSPTLNRCVFEGNWAMTRGGAICNQRGGSLTLRDCTFIANHAGEAGGAVGSTASDVNAVDCTFAGNVSENHGGALFCHEGRHALTGCTFVSNSARWGGGVYNLFGAMSVALCAFTANHADSEGGGIYIDSVAPVALTYCLLAGNRAGDLGGAVLVWSDSNPKLSNCTIADNRAPEGPAVSGTQPVLWNCIIWSQDSDGASFRVLGDGPTAGYSCIQGGWPGPGNIDADPLFAAPGYWDPNGTLEDPNDDVFVDGDYHLKSQAGRWDPNGESWVADKTSSLCIDAGDPSSDVGVEPFPNGGLVNMGAYGGTAQASKSLNGSALCGTTTYTFVPEQSVVIQTGGFAGVNWTYRLEGRFQVIVDCLTGTASFSNINVSATDESSSKRTLDLNEAFNMTNLVGTVGANEAMRFTGKVADGSDVVITLDSKGDRARIVGETIPPVGSADFFVLNLDAVAEISGGGKKGEVSQK